MNSKESSNHPLIRLVYKNLKHFFEDEKPLQDLEQFNWLDKKYLKKQAGVFVSYHKKGHLRGCIGTFQPTQESIAHEIRKNSIQAAFYDPRFTPLTYPELDQIKVSINILDKPYTIKNLDKHNPKKEGLIVKGKGQTGLLLPDLEGVDSAQKQYEICLKKAGIKPKEKEELQAFKVTKIEEKE